MMKYLWAPWRMKFIKEAKQTQGCVLCDLQKQEDSVENLILHRTPEAYVILNKYPYNTGHLMVVPTLHEHEFTKFDPKTLIVMTELLQKCVGILQKVYTPEGFNIGMNLGEVAGAGIPKHLHYHIVPRWGGDTNFMPVIGKTKVLPETVHESFHKLQPHF